MKQTNITKKLWLAALLTLILGVVLCVAVGAETYSGECGAEGDNLTWTLDTETGELVISGTGEMADYIFVSDVPWYSYKDSIKTVTVEEGVTNVGIGAFYDCSSLTSVTIPESVTNIGDDAFLLCSYLASATIPKGVTSIGNDTFGGCSSLKSLLIPESVTSIGHFAFQGCSSLKSVTIPKSVMSIGTSPFGFCTNLASITVDVDNSVYYSENNCIIEKSSKKLVSGCNNSVIPEDVTSLGVQAFYKCLSLTSITIPEGVTSIGYSAFEDCWSLKGVTVLSKTVEIYDSANTIYKTATIYGYAGSTAEAYATKYGRTFVALEEEPEFLCSGTCGDTLTWGLTTDGELIISGTGAMTEYVSDSDVPWYSYRNSVHTVTIKDGVTSIGNYAFTGCSTLTIVTIPEGVTSIGIYAFYECSSLTSVTIPEGVTSIGWWAFYHCSSLASITIPEGVTEIGHFMFEGCSSLTNVTIPDSVTVIGTYAFYECSSLVSLTIGEGVTYITEYAFGNCTDLASITVDADNSVYYSENNCIIEKVNDVLVVGCKNSVIPKGVRSIGSGAFYGCSSLTSVTIPEGVKYMGSEVFAKCLSLANVTIPESMTNSGFNTFAECSSLESVTVLSKTVQIYDAADTISDTATIYGYAGSTAEAYATKYGRTFVVLHEHSFAEILSYDGTNHWYACSGCDEKKDVTTHGYDNACDTSCNGCGYTRTITHSYKTEWSKDTTNHWYECSVCGIKKDTATHIYDNDSDTTCNACAYERKVTQTAVTTLRVVSGEVKAGESITVDVVIENNAGFAYLEISPVFPSELTLESVTNGALITDFEQGNQYIWVADGDVAEDGTLFTLTFGTTEDTAEGTYSVDFIVRMCGNMDEEDVAVTTVAGEITVVDFVWGDATGDGKINGFDIIRLKKYLAAYDYTTESSTVEIAKGADATGDGKINGFDIIRLKKYLAAYDYNTESSTVTLGPNK